MRWRRRHHRGHSRRPGGFYHQACDTVNNLNLKAFGEMKEAAADAVYQLALVQGPIRDGRPIKTHALRNNAFRGETALK